MSYSATLLVPDEYPTIQSAIDAASDGDEVLVSAGTYYENINFNGKNIVVQGAHQETTIIDGGQNGSVVKFENGEDSTTVLSEFTITNGLGSGNNNGGGGIYILESFPKLNNLSITNNNANWGGGVYIQIGASQFVNCNFNNNQSDGGGAIFNDNSSMILENCLIDNNSADDGSNGIYWGAWSGVGDYNNSNYIINSTIVGTDNLLNFSAPGSESTYEGITEIVNSIIWSEQLPAININGTDHQINFSYSDIQDGWEGEGNIDADPLFCNAENGDFTVQSDSPVLGTGQDGADMGAFGVGCETDVFGCTGESSCNYNPDATVDDGSCIYPDDHHDCYGNCLVELDCAGNCCVLGEEGCYWQETGPCGEEGPSDGMDSCGVCGGDNTSCMDCSGVPCSDAYMDNCGVCDDIPENDCVQDCAGTWGGDAVVDECGVCDSDASNDCVQDCAGVWGGELEWDCAGICGGDNSSYDGCCGLPPNDDCTDDCYIDSLGACCIEEDADECGVCFGDNGSCSGCTNSEATNYDSDATLDDGSCFTLGLELPDSLTIYNDYNEIPITLINPMSVEIDSIHFTIENGSNMTAISGMNINTNLIPGYDASVSGSPGTFSVALYYDPDPEDDEYIESEIFSGEGEILYLGIWGWDIGTTSISLTSLQINEYSITGNECHLEIVDILECAYDCPNFEEVINSDDDTVICDFMENILEDDCSDNCSLDFWTLASNECDWGCDVWSDMWSLDNQDDCEEYNCFWDNETQICSDWPTCGHNNQDDCEEHNCFWDNDACHPFSFLGDVNNDGNINVIDIVMTVDLILNGNYDVVADVNEDGQLNVIDIVILVDWVLNGMPEADSDGDGVIDEDDSDPNNPYQCSDLDGDTCDDCSTGTFNPSDDGYDYDGDGQCDDGDCDDDNDGCQECWDYCP